MSGINFGKRITCSHSPDGSVEARSESYFRNKPSSTKVGYSIPIKVAGNVEAFNEIIKCLDLVKTRTTDELVIIVNANTDGSIRMVTKEYFLSKPSA